MKTLLAVAGALIAAGCVLRAGGGDPDEAADAGGDPAIDAEPAPDAPLGEFGTPVRLTEVGSQAAEDDPSLTADMLEIYFSTTRDGVGEQLYVAKRDSVSEPFGAPVVVANVNDPNANDEDPGISPDGLTLYFSSNRAGGLGGDDIWVSTRPDRASDFGAPVNVTELNSAASEDGPSIVADGLTIVFEIDNDIYTATRASVGDVFDAPGPLALVDTSVSNQGAVLTSERTTIVFESDRPGSVGLDDLWIATRASPSDPFGPAQNLSELNTASVEADPWISDDLRTIVYQSDALGGNEEIFMATR